jgi:hypothetical protein
MKKVAFVVGVWVASLQPNVPLMAQTAAQPPTKSAPAKVVSAPPTASEIADAKLKGLVWTNPTTKVYHKGGEFYGKTTSGKFMTEAEAIKQYYRPSPDAMKETAKASATNGKKK